MEPVAPNIGHDPVAMTGKTLVIFPPEAASITTLRKEAREQGRLIGGVDHPAARRIAVMGILGQPRDAVMDLLGRPFY